MRLRRGRAVHGCRGKLREMCHSGWGTAVPAELVLYPVPLINGRVRVCVHCVGHRSVAQEGRRVRSHGYAQLTPAFVAQAFPRP